MLLSKAILTVYAATVAAAASDTCRLWLARSHLSTEERPRFGLFAGVEFQEDETLPNPDIGIPVVDMAADNYRGQDSFELMRDAIAYLESAVWMSNFAGANWEGNHSSIIFTPGMGTSANYHSGIYNVDWLQGSVLLRDRADLEEEGKASVGRGAYSNYYNMTMRATQKIPAGMEIFANFGE
jgi:hypothetical protein